MGRSKPKEYPHPDTGELVPSVTAVIGAYQESGFKGHIGHAYSRWAAQDAVEMLENYVLTGSLPVTQWIEKDGERSKRTLDLAKAEEGAAKALEDYLASRPFARLDAKADAGSLGHAVCAQFPHGPERGDLPGLLRDLWDESRAGPEPWRLTEAEAKATLASCERAWDWAQENVDEWLPDLGRMYGTTTAGLGYCGELDRRAVLKGWDDRWALDWKFGAKSKSHAAQVVGYMGLCPDETRGVVVYVGGAEAVAYKVNPDKGGPFGSPRAYWDAVVRCWYANRSEAGWLERMK